MATETNISSLTASMFTSATLNATALSGAKVYLRDASIPLNSTLDDASYLGTVKTDQTQLDVKAQISRENSAHFHKFTLDGDHLKLGMVNNTGSSGLRVQLLASNGKVIADSSQFAVKYLRDAYADLTSDEGLDREAGEYYVKVTFDATSRRGVPQTYSLGLYSGTLFTASYQTTAKAQTSAKQAVLIDKTMTYALIGAQAYENKTLHTANETAAEAVNIGWLYANKSALTASSWLTDVVKEQYYTFTLQKGEDLKMAFNNKTNTSDVRVQLFDSTGTKVLADNYGSEKQKAAYEKFLSSDGIEAKAGQYIVKVSFAEGAEKKKQIYDFHIYSGTTYDALYKTIAGTESLQAAMMNGHFARGFLAKEVSASYLARMSQGENINIMEILSQKI